jgi:hypothetical protein
MEPFVQSNLPGAVGGNSEKKVDMVDTVLHSKKNHQNFRHIKVILFLQLEISMLN